MSGPGCWMCHNRGSVQAVLLDDRVLDVGWIPGISTEGPLLPGERTCPACKGYWRPRLTFFPHQLRPPREITLDDVIADEQQHLDQLKAERGIT